MEHIAKVLARCAELLTLLDPQVVYAEPMPDRDDWPETEPVTYAAGLDLDVGDA